MAEARAGRSWWEGTGSVLPGAGSSPTPERGSCEMGRETGKPPSHNGLCKPPVWKGSVGFLHFSLNPRAAGLT